MSEKHTEGRLIVKGSWLIPEAHAGRMIGASTDKERDQCEYAHVVASVEGKYQNDGANARRLAACWDACVGFDTELLENIDMMGDTLKQRFEGMQAEVQRVDADARAIEANHEAARALLAEALKEAEDWHDECHGKRLASDVAERARAFLKGQP